MENNLDSLCAEMVKNVQEESDTITKQIKAFYTENKKNKDVKELTEKCFQEQITDFKSKYLNFYAGILRPKEDKFEKAV